jgi:hypothetical protein
MAKPGPRVAFFDIETAPIKGYTWTMYEANVLSVERPTYLLSYAMKWAGQKTVHTRCLPDYKLYNKDKENDRELAKDLWKMMDEADVIVGHNGDAFDIKKANARFITHGLTPPSPSKTIDTLKIARRVFKFDSNKLDSIGGYLGVGRKLPHTGIHLWLGCMGGDPKSWRLMRRYNAQDVRLLEQVYLKVRAGRRTILICVSIQARAAARSAGHRTSGTRGCRGLGGVLVSASSVRTAVSIFRAARSMSKPRRKRSDIDQVYDGEWQTTDETGRFTEICKTALLPIRCKSRWRKTAPSNGAAGATTSRPNCTDADSKTQPRRSNECSRHPAAASDSRQSAALFAGLSGDPLFQLSRRDRSGVQARCGLAGRLLIAGVKVYSPIAHTHPIAECAGLDPLDHDLWLAADEPFMHVAQAILVAEMDGWQVSKGIAYEMERFQKLGKPFYFIDPNTLEIK